MWLGQTYCQKKWSYKWISIPDIVFDKDCLMEGASERDHAHVGASERDHAHVVDQVLMHHVDPICKFSCMFYVPSCSHIDHWIVFLSRNGIKKLILMTKGRRDYDVPSSIFYCQELSHLELVNFILKVPSAFKGFHNLLVLNLYVCISDDAIAFLISKYPLLERLKLKTEALYQSLNVHAPNLRYFEFNGQFRDLKLGNSPLLTSVSMYSIIAPSAWDILDQRTTCSLVLFTNYSYRVERLALKGCSLQVKKIAGQSSQGSVDLISDLHEDVMNLILVRLPIRDVVRMSILSKKWRYKWVSIPNIIFDKESLMEGAPKLEHAYVVDQVLMHHVGPIYNFSCMSCVPSCSSHLIDSWIVFLSRNGIKKLILMLDLKEDRYDVPSSIFNCQELCHLELFNCRLRVPPTFKGFHKLLVLNLYVSISEDDIACLISKCPLLEMLELVTWNCDRCHIHAPNLRYLKLIGNFRDLALGSTPLLTNVFIEFYMPPYSWDDLKQGNSCSSIQFIGRPHGIERLSLKGCSIQFLSIGRVPKKLSTTYECLKYLEVDIELNSKEILATLCILRSSPNLKELKIEYCLDEEGAEFWGAETQSDCLLSHLRAVEIVGLAMLVDLEFIRYILSNAPVLETMKIYTCQFVEAKEVSRILEELFRFRRASTAKIIYLGHFKGS